MERLSLPLHDESVARTAGLHPSAPRIHFRPLMTLRETDRRGIAAALFGSVGLHLLLVLLMAWALTRAPVPPPPPPVQTLRVVVRPPSPPKPAPPKRVTASNPADAPEAPAPPARPLIESDRNVAAASERSGSGSAALPDQEGIRLESLKMERQSYTPDAQASAAAPVPAATAPPRPTPASPPEPKPSARPSPRDGAVAMMRPRATPVPTPPPRTVPAQVPQTAPSRYRPQAEPTRIIGGISNRGKTSVASLATPLGRYRKKIEDAIGSRWYHYVQARMELLNVGTVRLKFLIRADGTVSGLSVLTNTANEAFATCCAQAVTDAEMPAIPPELAETLENNELEVEYSFVLY
jgi:outer membrane biosynthesis protein TonB